MPEADAVVKLFAKNAGSYDEVVLRDRDYTAFLRIPEKILLHLGKTKKTLKVLDLGCGTGLSSKAFFDRGAKVTGVDITPEMIQQAKKLPFEKLLCASLEEPFPFSQEEFDVVLLLGVLEFISHPKKLFREIFKILKKGKIFGLTVPIKLSAEKEKKLEIFTYQREEMEKAFDECGFVIKEREEFQGFICEGETVRYYGYLLTKGAWERNMDG